MADPNNNDRPDYNGNAPIEQPASHTFIFVPSELEKIGQWDSNLSYEENMKNVAVLFQQVMGGVE